MLDIEELSYRIGDRLLLDRATARIAEGARVGMVGRNGTGKSTLVRLILGELVAERGDIRIRPGARLGHLPQEAPGGAETVRDHVLAADRERAALLALAETATDAETIADAHARLAITGADAAPARAAGILAGLGFDEAAQMRPLASFSGGWRMRAALAAQLFARPEILLLDEPSNHLDFEATLWLVDFLRRYPGTLLIVSHDRDILNEVATHILHLEGSKLTLYAGNYDAFERTRRERLERQAAMRARQEDQRKHLQAFVDRFRAKASKARQAQSRLKMLAKLQPIATAIEEDGVVFRFPDCEKLAPPIVTIDGASVGYQPGKPILRRLDLRIDDDDRIALLGRNGNGKSTLAKLLAGRLALDGGQMHRAGKLRIGYFGQHQIEELDPARSAFEHLAPLMPKALPSQVRARLGGFGLSQSRADTPAAQLSGGEKARLVFTLITLDRPNLLILDEPTNHLDIDTREALVHALNEFEGAAILISHDRHLVEATADRLWLVADGTVTPFDGDIEDYRGLLLRQAGRETGGRDRPGGGDNAADQRRAERRAAAERRAELAPLRKRARDAAAEVDRLARRKAEIDGKLADPAVYGGPRDKLAALLKEQGQATRSLEAAEIAWTEAEESLAAAEAAAG